MKDKKVSPTQKALNLWAMILIIWSFYRAYFKLPEWFDEFIAKPIVFVLPVFIYIKWIEKKDIFAGLYLNKSLKVFLKDFFISLGVGSVLLLTALLAVYLRFKKVELFDNFPGFYQLTLIFITALATGITEEILSRGFVLKRLYEESKNAYSSTFFASILFFFLHVPILFASSKINGNMLLMFMMTDLFLSMVVGLIMIQRKSLVAPILIHAFYNAIIILIFI